MKKNEFIENKEEGTEEWKKKQLAVETLQIKKEWKNECEWGEWKTNC